MQPSRATPDLARHLDDEMRTQERQLVGVRLAVVVLGIGFLALFGEPIQGRFALIGVLVGVAAYSLLIPVLLTRLPVGPVAALGVVADMATVTGVVWLASNVSDSYLFYALVILGTAVRFGMVASIVASMAMSLLYLAVVLATADPDTALRVLLPVRVLFLVTFGVVAGLFSRIIIGRAAENSRLLQRLQDEEQERDDLQDRVAREQHAQRAKDDFLSVVSHELRTPLTSIQGYSQLLEARLRSAERGESKELAHVRVILSQVTRMRRLVDDLLDVNTIDRHGGVRIEPVDFDLADVLRDAVARVAREQPEREIALNAPVSLPVHLDRERVDQVLSNLIENAVKYSPEGGPIRVAAIDHPHEVEVRVSDNGLGIWADQREHIFERFYQVDDGHGRGRRFGGLGLGLAISRAIVEGHGGRIWTEVNAEAGRGSVFAFRMPRAAEPADINLGESDEPPPFVTGSAGR